MGKKGGSDPKLRASIGIGGEKEYREALEGIGQRMKMLKSEMSVTTAEFKAQGATMENLKRRQGELNEKYDLQLQKVVTLRDMLEKCRAKYGENADETRNLQLVDAELKKNTQAMADFEAETALVVAAIGVAFLAGIRNVAGAINGAFITAVKAAGTALKDMGEFALQAAKKGFELSKSAGSMADDVLTTSQQTGIAADQLQKWTYAANFMDTPVDTITKSMAKMTKTVGDAADGSKTAQEKFKALGVDIRDKVTGELRDSEDIFADSIDALGKMTNETERDAAAMDLFGKSAQELNPLIEAGGDAITKLGNEAEKMGTVFSDSQLATLGGFDDSMQRMNATADGLANTIGLLLVPAFQPLVDAASDGMGKLSAALKDGLQPGELETIMDDLMGSLEDALADITPLIRKAIPVATKAAKAIIAVLAKELPKLVGDLAPAALELLRGFLDSMSDNSDEIGTMAADLIKSLVDFLIDAAPELVDASGEIVESFIDGLVSGNGLRDIVSGAVELLGKFAVALVKNASMLIAKGPMIIGELVKGLLDADWGGMAMELVGSLGDAITAAFTNADEIAAAYEQQFGATEKAWAAFKTVLDKADSNLESSQTDAEAKKTLATELLALYDQLEKKDIKTDADLTLMAGYAEQIAELYPQLAQYIDPATGLFNTNTQAIQNNINALAQLALVEGYQDYLKTVGQALAEFNIKLDDQTAKYQEAQTKLTELQTAADNAQGMFDNIFGTGGGGLTAFEENLTQIYNTIKQFSGIENPMAGFVDVLADGTVKLKDGTDVIAAYDSAMSQLGDAVSGTNSALSDQKGVVDTAQGKMKEYQDGAEATKQKLDGIVETITKETAAYNAMTPAATAAGTAGQAAGDAINAGGDSALEGAGKMEIATGKLADGKDAAGEAADGAKVAGDEIATEAEKILATAEDIKGAQAAAEAAQTKIAELLTTITTDAATALTTMETIAASITLTAQGMMAAIETAIEDSTVTNAAAGSTMATTVTKAIAAILTEAQGMLLGGAIGKGVKRGLDGQRTDVATSAGALATAASSALWSVVGRSGINFESIGEAIDQGMARGIRNNTSVITSAARAAARAAYQAAKNELDIRSPSHVMEGIGEQYDAGFGRGIERNMQGVVEAAAGLSRTAAGSTAVGTRSAASTPFTLDYARLGAEVAAANKSAGIGTAIMTIDGKLMATTLEPDVSRATRRRSTKSVSGRNSRMTLV